MVARASGVLLHPTSLPGRFGIGDLGSEARGFLRWLASSGQSVWQILPLMPPGQGNSPYTALSSAAGSPLLISPEYLRNEGLVEAPKLDRVPDFPNHDVDFARVREWKEQLRWSWQHTSRGLAPASVLGRLEAFVGSKENEWLGDWALFAALKDRFDGASWTRWPKALRLSVRTARKLTHPPPRN